jgi:hypothetical protein
MLAVQRPGPAGLAAIFASFFSPAAVALPAARPITAAETTAINNALENDFPIMVVGRIGPHQTFSILIGRPTADKTARASAANLSRVLLSCRLRQSSLYDPAI